MKMSFTGDIMCEKPLLKSSKKNGEYKFDNILFDIKKKYGSQYVIGNLETVFAGKSEKYTNHIYSFNTPDDFVDVLKQGNIDCVTTANNHCLDRGVYGIKRTIDVLNKNGINHIGTYKNIKEKENPFIVEKDGRRIGILAYTYGTNYSINKNKLNKNERFMVDMLKPETVGAVSRKGIYNFLKDHILTVEQRVKLKKILGLKYNQERIDKLCDEDINTDYMSSLKRNIESVKEQADYVIVCLHSGGQFNLEPGEYTKKIVDILFAYGVDFIIGNHPHIVQKIIYKEKKLCAFSLGNLIISPDSVYIMNKNLPIYSLILHVEIQNIKIIISVSIVKIILKSKTLEVKDTFELFLESKSETEKEELVTECKRVFQNATGIVGPEFELKKEYKIKEWRI